MTFSAPAQSTLTANTTYWLRVSGDASWLSGGAPGTVASGWSMGSKIVLDFDFDIGPGMFSVSVSEIPHEPEGGGDTAVPLPTSASAGTVLLAGSLLRRRRRA